MTHEEFVKKYIEFAARALKLSEKARREGLLALEEESDQEKIDNRDIFEYGLRFVIDGTEK
jgi:flagellar motor component MotA